MISNEMLKRKLLISTDISLTSKQSKVSWHKQSKRLAKLKSKRLSFNILVQKQLAEVKAETPSVRATPAANPRKAAKKRAEALQVYFSRRKWTKLEINWVLAQAAVLEELSIDDIATSMGQLTIHRYQRRSTSSPQKLNVDVAKFKDLHRVTEGKALSLFLSSIEAKVLVEEIPAEARRMLIRQWVAKVQEFWSKDRCALLKSATTTSNEKWTWFRALLGRVVVNGKWEDHAIDGTLFSMHQSMLMLHLPLF